MAPHEAAWLPAAAAALVLFCAAASQLVAASPVEKGAMCPRKAHLLGDRRCRKQCTSDADCKAGNRRCLCDDVCGLSCLNPEQKCEPATTLINGRVSVEPNNRLGAVARYHCSPGYRLHGAAERVCQGDRRWSGAAPTCEDKAAAPPPLTDLPQAIDSAAAAAAKGASVTCGEPPAVNHADHNGEKRSRFESGATLTYTCRDGYAADGIAMAICKKDGSWAGPSMTCIEIVCADPPAPEGGRVSPLAEPPHRVGKTVTYECHAGYRLVGNPSRLCLSSGAWDGTHPTCERIGEVVCPKLKTPRSGLKHGKDQHAGSVVTFTCEVGHTLSGSSRRVCLSNGNWSGSEATCNPVDCGTPGPIYQGYIEGQKTTRGSLIKYRCLDATTFDGLSRSATCLESGKWSFPPPKCWRSCLRPHIDGATVHLEDSAQDGKPLPAPFQLLHGSTISVACDSKLALTDSRQPSCINGTWSSMPQCVPLGCRQRPSEIENGVVQYRGSNHGDRARYRCNAGFSLRGEPYVQCMGGEWQSGPLPHCVPVFCSHPGELANGRILLADSRGTMEYPAYIEMVGHGDSVAYYCQAGFRLVGPSAATCIAGAWSPESRPLCVSGQHPEQPPSIANMRT